MNVYGGHSPSEPATEDIDSSPGVAGSQNTSDMRRDIDTQQVQSTDDPSALENETWFKANDQPGNLLFRPPKTRATLLAELQRLIGVFEAGRVVTVLTESAEAIVEDAQRISQLQFELQNSLENRLGLADQLELTRLEVKQLEQDISSAKEELGTCSARLKKKKKQECETLVQDVDRLEASEAENQEKLHLASSQLEQACGDIAAIGAERTALKEEVKELKQVGDRAQKEVDDLREQLTQKTEDHDRVVEDLDRKDGEHKTGLQQKLAESRETYTEAFIQLNKTRLDNATLAAGQALSAKEADRSKQEVEGLQAKVIALKQHLAMENGKCADVADDNVQLEERNASLACRLEEVETETQQLRSSNETLRLWSGIVVQAADGSKHALQHLQKYCYEHNEYLSALQLSHSKAARATLESILESVKLEYSCSIDSVQSVKDLRARPSQDCRGARARMERWMRAEPEYLRLGFKKLSRAVVVEDFVFPVLRIECTPSRNHPAVDLNGKVWIEPTVTMPEKDDKRYMEGNIYHGMWPALDIKDPKHAVLPGTPTTPGLSDLISADLCRERTPRLQGPRD